MSKQKAKTRTKQHDMEGYKRGEFHKRNKVTAEETKTWERKVKISIYLDSEVLNEFRRRGELPGAAPYQNQINSALREYLGFDKPEDAFKGEFILLNGRAIAMDEWNKLVGRQIEKVVKEKVAALKARKAQR